MTTTCPTCGASAGLSAPIDPDLHAVCERPPLFATGSFTAHSGETLPFKIDCDALTDTDIDCLAEQAARMIGTFSAVRGIPRGGVRFAKALQRHETTGPVLIVDDVLTTGASMEAARRHAVSDCKGVVIFARRNVPEWVIPLFVYGPVFERQRAALREILTLRDFTPSRYGYGWIEYIEAVEAAARKGLGESAEPGTGGGNE